MYDQNYYLPNTANFIFAFISLSLLFSVLIFLISIYLSHHLSGPLYAFELYVEHLLQGRDRVLKLREGDQSKHLERIAADLKEHFDKSNALQVSSKESMQDKKR